METLSYKMRINPLSILFFCIFLIVVLVLPPTLSLAQIPVGAEPFSIKFSPPHPQPNSAVTLSLQSFSNDLEQAEIAWLVNGELQLRARGATSFTLATGGLGTAALVTIVVQTRGGAILEQSAIVRPAAVDLFVEVNTYVPPFYPGRALLSGGASANVIALPDMIDGGGRRVDPSEARYTWKKDGKVLGPLSGVGRQILTTTVPLTAEQSLIEVEVVSLDGSVSARSVVNLEPRAPIIRFYERHPLRGMLYEQSLSGNAFLTAREVTIVAEPFFFNTSIFNSGIGDFQWSIDGLPVVSTGQRNELTLRNEEGGEVFSTISLRIQNLEEFLQFGAFELSITQ